MPITVLPMKNWQIVCKSSRLTMDTLSSRLTEGSGEIYSRQNFDSQKIKDTFVNSNKTSGT